MRRSASGINCLIAVDKPLGLSSHDVVNCVRRILGERRVGHAGTLDPAASGVLVLGVGQAARLLGMLTLDDKRYDARIAFGAQTSTDDAEGEVIRTADVPERLGDQAVAQVVCYSLIGPCDQTPPAYSAISIDGKRAYDRARAGEEVELPVRHVQIYDAQLMDVTWGDELVWHCSFHVSKGTYIRSIARDLGESLGTASHLCGLRRTASGPISLERCVTLQQLEEAGPAGVLGLALDPVLALQLPHHELNDYELQAVGVGRQFGCRNVTEPNGAVRAPQADDRVSLVRDGLLMGVWEMRGQRLACVANFPDGIQGVRQ